MYIDAYPQMSTGKNMGTPPAAQGGAPPLPKPLPLFKQVKDKIQTVYPQRLFPLKSGKKDIVV